MNINVKLTFSNPSNAIVTIFTSFTVNKSHRGRMHPCWTRNLICCGLPPLVAFEMAHAASLRISNSALANSWINGGMMLLSITDCIWSLLPAVMFDMVQHASFRMPFFGLERRARRQERALLLMQNCVWRSSPEIWWIWERERHWMREMKVEGRWATLKDAFGKQMMYQVFHTYQ